MSLPEKAFSWLPYILAQPALVAFARALNTLVTSANGGNYASFRAYLADKLAYVHPLYAELHRAVFGEGAFTSGGVVAGVSVPQYSAVFPTRLYRGADGALAEETTDASSATTADVTLTPTNGHSVYVGSDHPFQAIVFALSTLGTSTITPAITYWNGSAWTTLTATDNTAGFTASDIITFTPPADWSRTNKDAGGTAFADTAALYYVRINRTNATGVTPAVGTCVTIIPTPVLNSAGKHIGLQQPPLAIFRITGTNAQAVTLPVANIEYTRFSHPLSSQGKIRLRFLTSPGADVTPTVQYVDQSGNNGSTAQSAITSPAALDTATVSLTNTTDGLRSVRTTSPVTTSATGGIYVLECLPIRTPAV